MPSWKKVITSGSNAVLNDITSSGDIKNTAGDFTLDAVGDIILDADNADVILKDSGTEFGRFSRVSSDLVIKSATSNKDVLIKGNDGGSTITALKLDMSDAGSATFNNHITASGDVSGSSISTGSFGEVKTKPDGRMISNLTEVIEVIVDTSSGNRYKFEGEIQPNLVVSEGKTYRFDQSHSTNSTHPFRFSTTLGGEHEGGSEYTTGVITHGTPGNSGAYTEIKITKETHSPLYYYCTAHSGMGGDGQILKNDLTDFKGNLKVDAAFTVTQTASSISGANNIDLSAKNNYNLTLTGNVTLTPTNLTGREGQSGLIALIQDSSGGHSITLNSLFKTPRGDSITFDTTANGIALMSYYVVNTSNVAVNYLGPFS